MFMNAVMILIICVVLYSVYRNGLGLETFSLNKGKGNCVKENCIKGSACKCD